MKVINVIKNGNRIQGYEVQCSNGTVVTMTKKQIIKEIEDGNISNATLQVYMGSYIVRIKEPKNKSVKEPSKISREQSNISNKIKVASGQEANNILLRLQKGTPLKVKVTEYNGFEQVIFCGIREVQYREAFLFFNGQGLDGTFALSSRFIENNNEIQIKLNDNEPTEVARLISMMGM